VLFSEVGKLSINQNHQAAVGPLSKLRWRDNQPADLALGNSGPFAESGSKKAQEEAASLACAGTVSS